MSFSIDFPGLQEVEVVVCVMGWPGICPRDKASSWEGIGPSETPCRDLLCLLAMGRCPPEWKLVDLGVCVPLGQVEASRSWRGAKRREGKREARWRVAEPKAPEATGPVFTGALLVLRGLWLHLLEIHGEPMRWVVL